MENTNSVFVKIEKYKDVLDILNVINKKLDSVREKVSQLEEIKSREDDQIMGWEKEIEEISYKMENLKEELMSE